MGRGVIGAGEILVAVVRAVPIPDGIDARSIERVGHRRCRGLAGGGSPKIEPVKGAFEISSVVTVLVVGKEPTVVRGEPLVRRILRLGGE